MSFVSFVVPSTLYSIKMVDYLAVLMIDHNVMRLHISVHNTLAVAKVQRFEQLQNVEPHIEVVELGVQAPKVGVIDVLEDEGGRLALHGRSS